MVVSRTGRGRGDILLRRAGGLARVRFVALPKTPLFIRRQKLLKREGEEAVAEMAQVKSRGD